MKIRRAARLRFSRIAGAVFTIVALSPLCPARAATPSFIATDQGADWTPDARLGFYSHDQGSRIMPYRWMAALKQPDGEAFLAASLSRYGYLPNDASDPAGLPVGFVVAKGPDGQNIGMT